MAPETEFAGDTFDAMEIVSCAIEWREAREACLTVPVTPQAYDRLADAEASLYKAVKESTRLRA